MLNLPEKLTIPLLGIYKAKNTNCPNFQKIVFWIAHDEKCITLLKLYGHPWSTQNTATCMFYLFIPILRHAVSILRTLVTCLKQTNKKTTDIHTHTQKKTQNKTQQTTNAQTTKNPSTLVKVSTSSMLVHLDWGKFCRWIHVCLSYQHQCNPIQKPGFHLSYTCNHLKGKPMKTSLVAICPSYANTV